EPQCELQCLHLAAGLWLVRCRRYSHVHGGQPRLLASRSRDLRVCRLEHPPELLSLTEIAQGRDFRARGLADSELGYVSGRVITALGRWKRSGPCRRIGPRVLVVRAGAGIDAAVNHLEVCSGQGLEEVEARIKCKCGHTGIEQVAVALRDVAVARRRQSV